MLKAYLIGLIIAIFSFKTIAQSTTITPEGGILGQYTNQKISILTESNGYGIEHTNGNIYLSTFISTNTAWLLTKSNHPLFFTTNNKVEDGTAALSILTNGNIGVGTIFPSEKLHVEGNARITGLGGNGVKFVRANNIGILSSGPQISYLNIPRSTFLSVSGHMVGFNENGGIYCMGNTAGFLEAPVNLPDGAIITNIAAYYADNSSKNVRIQFYRRTYADNSSSLLSTLSSTGAAGNMDIQNKDVDIDTDNVIDNNNYVYYVRVSAIAIVNNNEIPTTWGDGTNLTINQLKVTYSY
ncbi:hypothetical protein [Emticicia sp. C21]|uniref:hypothetical protein n=1 Tax=Emticicia sp. C21 TaxID=2302915 RepID=UPI000E350A2A|nr:hypothetical protein [Emticicia sp. C21]RFS16418.1 hypothetical protein D0T08_12085 [Emticicia sp. C21]